MAYPDNIDNFTDKLNKLDNNTYVIEEEVALVNGVYEGELQHDNVSLPSINVYTGSKLTGTKVENIVISTPSLTPWKNTIRIYSEVSPVYITYQTQGDTVEADDINKVQNSIVNTQKTLNNEITRAINAETTLTNNLNSEITRAKNSETTISNALTSETSRAESSEATITTNLNAEITRATNSENNISNTITTNTPVWNDKYTKNEVDNKISAVITNLDYKEHVATFADLATTYPNPQDGWTVSVDADNITYKYNGTSWIPISANSIPLATESVSGLLSSQDKTNFDDANAKKHTHSNLSLLETITQVLINNWNSAYTHISDAVRHITSAERSLWNTVSNKVDKSGDTISGQLTVLGNAQNRPIVTRGISGSSSDGTTVDSLYLNYDSNKPVQIGTTITIDPSTSSITAKASDSDAVGGHPATDFAPSGYGLGGFTPLINSTDANTVISTGFYYGNNISNVPTVSGESTAGYLLVEASSSNWVKQTYCTYTNSKIFVRTNNNGTWTSWKSLASSGDIPTSLPANGGNADMVGGKHATDFMARTISSTTLDFNTVKTSGVYSVKANTNSPNPSYNGTLIVEFEVGTPYQLWCPDNLNTVYKRNYTVGSSTWGAWVNLLGLDTLGADAKYALKTDITNLGTGDMQKATYDKDGDGIVDNSEALQGHPASDFMLLGQAIIGEQHFGYGSYVDPYVGLSCALKINGNLAVGGTIYENQKQVLTKGVKWNDLKGV
ncbi:pyocin knob domain-containing protein [Clostridium hydrogenum]|uniref:pyocin knob domain-containing protein n=1 Tax=Clostridium hydrogenum TaxID=2855764 RepID=UPI001F3B987F|nr:pyocin knob domain-containing protein [Clostridium hydrogenum]